MTTPTATPRVLLVIAAIVAALVAPACAADGRPNVVVILCDNLGNGDIACFNPGTKHRTPHLDRMAAEGRKFTSFYSASSVCTPSRAALMTGCYPRRVGLHISAVGGPVLAPVAARGIHSDEETVAELLNRNGYATACFGKWHLGDQPDFLPNRNGFDTFLGIPYSEDMVLSPPLPLMHDETVVEAPVSADTLTSRITAAAVRFIAEHRGSPFFLYVPVPGPGSRAESYPSPTFRGKSANGLYGDSIEELDWSVGEILAALERNGLDDDTLVIWTDDNGAVDRNPPQGSNAPYKGTGYSTSEGGQRVPCIARWPGKVPAGTTCTQLCTMMDLLPTIVALTGSKRPQEPIDGHDIRPLLFGEQNARSPYDGIGFCYYQVTQLQAVREGNWKLYLPLEAKRGLGKTAGNDPPQKLALYDVQTDVAEQHEASAKHPEIVRRLLGFADTARRVLGDDETPGASQRAPGHVDLPTPRTKAAAAH